MRAAGFSRWIARMAWRARVSAEAVTVHVFTTDRKSTRLNSSHDQISYAVFCLKKKNIVTAALNPGPPLAAALALLPARGAPMTYYLLNPAASTPGRHWSARSVQRPLELTVIAQ